VNFLVVTDPQDARRVARLLLWLFDLPARGTHHGGGVHVDQPDTLPDPPPLRAWGWTTRQRGFLRRRDAGAWAIRITQPMRDAWRDKRGLLPPEKRAWVQTLLDTSLVTLDPATWDDGDDSTDHEPGVL